MWGKQTQINYAIACRLTDYMIGEGKFTNLEFVRKNPILLGHALTIIMDNIQNVAGNNINELFGNRIKELATLHDGKNNPGLHLWKFSVGKLSSGNGLGDLYGKIEKDYGIVIRRHQWTDHDRPDMKQIILLHCDSHNNIQFILYKNTSVEIGFDCYDEYGVKLQRNTPIGYHRIIWS